MVFKKECNNAKHARLLGIIKKIEDRYFSIELIKDVENRYLNYHMKLIINPGTSITVDYESSKYYFKDHQSYDHAQKLLDKVKKSITEEDYFTDVSGLSSSNSDHDFEVIETSNTTSERSEYGSYARRSKFICNLDYV